MLSTENVDNEHRTANPSLTPTGGYLFQMRRKHLTWAVGSEFLRAGKNPGKWRKYWRVAAFTVVMKQPHPETPVVTRFKPVTKSSFTMLSTENVDNGHSG